MADQQSDSGNDAKQSFLARQLLLDTTKNAFQQLSGLLKNVTLYPASHPYLISLAEKMTATIEGLLQGREDVTFYFVHGELFFEIHSVPIDENTTLLMELFADRDIGGIAFKPGFTTEELIKLAILMSKEPAVLREGIMGEILSSEDISHIDLHRSVVLIEKKSESKKTKEDEQKPDELFKEAIEAIKGIVQNVQLNKAINMRKMNMVIQSMVESINDNRDALMGVTGVKMHDQHALAHLVNTSILAMSLASFLSFEKKQVIALGLAAMLHDIGKVRVPNEIINKLDHLTSEEWEAVERHPIEGALIISDIPGITKMAMVTAFEHHQHGGAHGYPQIESAGQHLFSQIVSLADAYEVLTAVRVYYNAPMPSDEVIRTLVKKRGSDFNATLVKAFINMIGIFPIGTLLKFSSEEIGLVVHQTSDLMRPRFLLLTKFDGSEKESGEEISLLEMTEGKYKRDIVGTINHNTANIDIKRYMV
jgi:HD-GYP domain-containing protein (c-di-GMP phosphodiesterase class II)